MDRSRNNLSYDLTKPRYSFIRADGTRPNWELGQSETEALFFASLGYTICIAIFDGQSFRPTYRTYSNWGT